jgi:Flp pilus assembly protein TadD
LAKDAASVPALVELGRLEIANGDYSAAVSHLETADRLNPHSREVKQHLAAALSAAGKKKEALKLFQELETGDASP